MINEISLSKKTLIALIMFLLIITICSTSFAEIQLEIRTEDFEIGSYYDSGNNDVQYGVRISDNNQTKLVSIKASQFGLPLNLYEYKDEIRLRVTYTLYYYDVSGCEVINYKTGEVIEDLSEENINKLFNIEYGKTTIEKEWVNVINLSELKENEIYKYTANGTVQFPEIKNDLGKNCIIYRKQWHDTTYEKKIIMYKEIDSQALSASFNEYQLGDSFSIMYKIAENQELLKMIEKDKIIYLSNYKDGDKLEYRSEEYIYNDTNNNINVSTKNIIMRAEISNSIVMGKGEIYGFDWMIDSVTISYLEDTGNGNQDGGIYNNQQNQVGNVISDVPNNDENINSFFIVLYITIGVCSIGLVTVLITKVNKK